MFLKIAMAMKNILEVTKMTHVIHRNQRRSMQVIAMNNENYSNFWADFSTWVC
jgi:hypothetical protein